MRLTQLRANSTKEVPVATYVKDNKTSSNAPERSTISVDKSKALPRAVSTVDAGRNAVAFDRSVIGKMTPTMRSFTLEGKVAIITGYVWLLFEGNCSYSTILSLVSL